MTPKQAADAAWRAYTAALRDLSTFRNRQLPLLDNPAERAAFWRGTWVACERECVRTMA